MDREIPELFDIIEHLQNNAYDLWERIRAIEGDRFVLRFCCNSQRVQRARMEYTPRGNFPPRGEQAQGMPHEAADIISACRDNAKLKKAIEPVSSSKLDIYFVCEHYSLRNWGYEEVS